MSYPYRRARSCMKCGWRYNDNRQIEAMEVLRLFKVWPA